MNADKFQTVVQNIFFWIAIGILHVTGCSDSENKDAVVDDITYVCLETHKVMELPRAETPAINPETGKRTLVEGRYCADCKKWYPFPQTVGFGGQPAICVCPVHGHALVAKQDSD